MWFDQSVVYQIYPLGLCGAPEYNDGVEEHRILRVLDWVEHIKETGADTVLFNPLFDGTSTATTRGITSIWTAARARTRTLSRAAGPSTEPGGG